MIEIPTGRVYICYTNHALQRISERDVFLERRHVNLDDYVFVRFDKQPGQAPVLKFRKKYADNNGRVALIMRKGKGNRYNLITAYYD